MSDDETWHFCIFHSRLVGKLECQWEQPQKGKNSIGGLDSLKWKQKFNKTVFTLSPFMVMHHVFSGINWAVSVVYYIGECAQETLSNTWCQVVFLNKRQVSSPLASDLGSFSLHEFRFIYTRSISMNSAYYEFFWSNCIPMFIIYRLLESETGVTLKAWSSTSFPACVKLEKSHVCQGLV